MIRFFSSLLALILFAAATGAQETTADVKTVHALSLTGEPKYGPDFTQLDYVNVDAPQGGHARMGIANATFDSLNPFIMQGAPAAGLGNVYEALMSSPYDDISAEYGLLAESVTYPDDFSWVEFTLRPQARWHDGKPVRVEDVIFSFNIITEKGQPFYAAYYANVVKVEKTGARRVKFTFDQAGNRELPQIMGQLVVLPEHDWTGRAFNAPTLQRPLGSGPYRVGEVKPGRSITLERVPDYWGKDLPINRGQNNFARISFEYFRDAKVAIEALKAGAFDFRAENSSKDWATEYDFPALRRGDFVKEIVAHKRPAGMQGFVFNTRRAKFADPRVRQAIAYAFDFEWSNRNLFYGQYTRTESYFANSELASRGLPSAAELALLEPLRAQVPQAVFTTPFRAPKTDGSGNNRENLRKAALLLREAGWRVRDGVLTGPDGTPLSFEILLVQPSFERVAAPFADNLKILGITASIRVVDASQYQARREEFDYDMIVESIAQSLSPGNEQREFFGSAAANKPGSRNYAGVANPAVDRLIDAIIFAKDRAALVTATRALDRVLLHSHFVVPQHHINAFRLAYWNRFSRPEISPAYHHGFPLTWWWDAKKAARIKPSGSN